MTQALGNMRNALEDFFVDSKLGNAVIAVVVIMLFCFGGPALVSAISDATSEGYTGTGVVTSHEEASHHCYVEVKKEDGSTDKMSFGTKLSCYRVTDGMTVQIVKGNIK